MNWLERQVMARPSSVAVVEDGIAITYQQLGDRVSRVAAALQAAGVKRGSRVATLLSNSSLYVTTIHAIAWAGATIVPINVRLTDDEVSWLLGDVGADLLIVDHGSHTRSLDLGSTRFVQVEDLTFSLQTKAAPADMNGPATILYTSGTTGLPKPVPLTWGNHSASAAASAFNLGINEDDNWLCAIPLCHIGGLSIVYRSVLYGTALTICEGFDVDEVIGLVESGSVTLASFVPTMLYRLWNAPQGTRGFSQAVQKGRLRAVLLGGGPADSGSLALCKEHHVPVFQTYGLTEASSQVTTTPPSRAMEKLGSAGIPVHGVELQVQSDEGKRAAPGQTGSILVRGRMVTSGYLGRSAENQRRFQGSWFDTGDYGYLDEDGFLWVIARREDLIVRGGENVYPAEVENVLLSHPEVREVAVFGMPSDEWGQQVAAALVTDTELEPEALVEFCTGKIARFKIPSEWIFMENLPKTASGKIRRYELR